MGHEEIDLGFTSSISVKVTEKMIQQFAEMSGDHNPIHMNEEYAKKTRFGKRIAHGMISGALISRALVDCLGGTGIYLGQSLKFVNPVFIDDVIIITLKVTGIRKEKRIATVETNVTKENGDLVVKGEAVIMLGVDMEHKV